MRTNYYQRKVVGLYLIQHRETLRSYCGQSRDVLSRWKSHCSGGKKAVGIGAAIRDEGVDSFTFRVLEECSVSQLNEREVFWIEHYDCVEPHGYNRNSGGGAPTYVSAETRKNLSVSMKGKTASPETKAKMSASQTGRTASPETKAKMSAAFKGRTLSPEHREQISAAQIGRTFSQESKDKMSAAAKGKTHSSESRAKMQLAKLGKTLSQEHKEKLSAAAKGKTQSTEHIASRMEGMRRAREARSAAIEAQAYAAPLQKLTDTLRHDSTWTPMAEDGTPLSVTAAPTLEELEEMLGLL